LAAHENGRKHLLAAGVAKASLAAVLVSTLAGPWAETVVTAARLEEASEGVEKQLSRLPTLSNKAVPILDRDSNASMSGSNSTRRLEAMEKAEPARNLDLNLGDAAVWATEAAGTLTKEVGDAENAAAKAIQAGATAVGTGINSAVNSTVKAIPGLVNGTESLLAQGKTNMDKGVQAATKSTGHAIVDITKRIVVKPPDTRTTTVEPLHVPTPPETRQYRHFLQPALQKLKQAILHWVAPVVLDLALISCAFLLFETVAGVGRHAPAYRRGSLSAVEVASRLASDVYVGWVWGAALLVALWVVGILLSQELRGFAEKIQDSPVHPAVSICLGIVCAGACGYHAFCLSRLEETDPERSLNGAKAEEGDSLAPSESFEPLLTTDAPEATLVKPKAVDSKAAETAFDDQLEAQSETKLASLIAALSWTAAALISMLSGLVSAVEGPMFTAAVSNSYKSAMGSTAILGLIPWEHLAPEVNGRKIPLLILLGAVAVAAAALGALLFFLQRLAGGKAPKKSAETLVRPYVKEV